MADHYDFWDNNFSRGYLYGGLGGITHIYKDLNALCAQLVYDAVLSKTQLKGSELCYRDTMIHVGNEKGLPPYSKESNSHYGERLSRAIVDWTKAGTLDFVDLLQPINDSFTFALNTWFDRSERAYGTIPFISSSANWPSQFSISVIVPGFNEGGTKTSLNKSSRLIGTDTWNDIVNATKMFKPLDQACRYVEVQSEDCLVHYTIPNDHEVHEAYPFDTTIANNLSTSCSGVVSIKDRIYYTQYNQLIKTDLFGLNPEVLPIPGTTFTDPISLTATLDENDDPIIFILNRNDVISKIVDGDPFQITGSWYTIPYGSGYVKDITANLDDNTRVWLVTSNGLYWVNDTGQSLYNAGNATAVDSCRNDRGEQVVLYTVNTYPGVAQPMLLNVDLSTITVYPTIAADIVGLGLIYGLSTSEAMTYATFVDQTTKLSNVKLIQLEDGIVRNVTPLKSGSAYHGMSTSCPREKFLFPSS